MRRVSSTARCAVARWSMLVDEVGTAHMIHPKLTGRRRLAIAAMAVLTVTLAPCGQALAQFDKPLRLLVGYAAGGPVDSMARIVAPLLAHELGQLELVANMPGVSGALGGEATVGAVPDGLTLFFAAGPTITIMPHILKKMRWDPARDLTPIAPVLS